MYQRRVTLDADQKAALAKMRDTGAKSYLRERAAAILKVAEGLPAKVVARERLLRPRRPDTVCGWLDRFQEDGIAALGIKSGRGRKAAFSQWRQKWHCRAGCDKIGSTKGRFRPTI